MVRDEVRSSKEISEVVSLMFVVKSEYITENCLIMPLSNLSE